jgi:16S rRNA pseudouridine516 synthase
VGPLVQRLTSPRHRVEKTYVATLDGDVTDATVRAFAEGVPLREGGVVEPAQPARLEALGPGRARVTVDEGRYHQVRRMFAACGLTVTALERTRFGAWTLDGLAPGEWRALPLP